MANKAKLANLLNHKRQLKFLSMGVVMLPKKKWDFVRGILKQNGVKAT